MNNPSVTIFHKEGYAAAGLLFGGAVLNLFLNMVLLPQRLENQVLGYAIAVMAVVLAVVFLLWARCTETIDENGIHIKGPFSGKQYSWDTVQRVGIIPPPGKDFPKFEIRVAGRKSPLRIDYTKRTEACVRRYYGAPDYDQWGKPPTAY